MYRSAAMGACAGSEFLNSAWVLETTLEPIRLLDLLQEVENEFGRSRDVRWGPRTLDLDLIFYDHEVVSSPRLIVPHSHCWYRRFVLTPIEDLRPDWLHPELGLTIRDLCKRLSVGSFRLAIGGAGDLAPTLTGVVREFQNVELVYADSPDSIEVSDVSLAVWFGECSGEKLHPLWLKSPTRDALQALRDTLTAACTAVVAI
ncbi:MAG: 2-amino-4-hydroxy-6-hydroxymethyldihydropteridine diphosphokinase, partial [Planctomycetota bacterium]|nr:2-amino-4-hydroxy-6-hydroxymethyldihydropteridine diphosphokinase [Planctomycetota bacterium]